MKTDNIFDHKNSQLSDFKFGKEVVDVFDDMVVRSVPYYMEIQRMMVELASSFAKPGTNLYDLGCSTGTTMMTMSTAVDEKVKFVGVDQSPEMLESCRDNLQNFGLKHNFDLQSFNLDESVTIENASVVILCLTLQFVRPLNRTKLIQSIYNQLNTGGCIILVEKVLGESHVFNRPFIDYYYDFKRRNNYSELEISQKREALENILVPYKLSEDIEMLEHCGFTDCETFFKWYNFAGMIAVKK